MRIISSSGIKIIYDSGKVEQIAYNDIKTLNVINFGVNAEENIIIRTYRHKSYRIPFSDVTEPLFATVEELAEELRKYNLRMGNSQEFEATVGQTNFTTTFELADAETYYIDGSIQYIWFNRVGPYEFVYSGPPFRGGEKVTVKN